MVQTDTKNRVGGTAYVKIDGVQIKVRGKWTLNYGEPKRDGVAGLDGTHGYIERPQVCYVEGEVTPDDARKLSRVTNSTITIEWGAGRVDAWRSAWFAGEGTIDVEEGMMAVRFEALSCEKVR